MVSVVVSSEDPRLSCLQKADFETHFSIDYLKKQGLFIHIMVYNCQPCDKSPTQCLVNYVENSGHINRSNEVEVREYNGARPQPVTFKGQRSNLSALRS